MLKITKSIIAIIFAVSVGLGMFVFVFSEKKTFSENENKNLAKFPEFTLKSLESGDFTADLEEYMKDHFPLRDPLMKLKTKAQLAAGYKRIGDVHIGKDRLFQQVDKPDVSSFVASSNKLFSAIENKDITTSVILLPSASEIYENELPSYTEHIDEKTVINDILSQIDCDNAIDPTDMLLEKKAENNLFYTTDHHWTTYGAYLAYVELMEAWGMEAQPLDAFTVETVSNEFYGTAWRNAGMKWITPDEIEYYRFDGDEDYTMTINDNGTVFEGFYDRSYLDVTDQYSSFISGNNAYVTIEKNGVEDRERLLLVKDSFGHSLAPFLAYHFDLEIVDLRYY